jgi:hypothetical protein
MKKYTLLIFILILAFSAKVFSQDEEEDENNFKHFNIGFNAGTNTPEGTYAKNDSVALFYYNSVLPNRLNQRDTNSINGYAKSVGFHFNVYVLYRLSMRFGFMLSAGGNFNSFDVSSLNANESSEYSGYSFGGSPPSFTCNGSYYVGEYLFGPYLKFPIIRPDLSVEFKALLGMATANYPTLTYSYDYMGTTATQTEVVKNGNGLAYTIGGGFKYTILHRLIGLHLGANYTRSNITYPGFTMSSSSGGVSTSPVYYSIPKSITSVALIQFTFGVSVEF